MDNVKQQVVDRLKQANNILVTVRANPTIDLLSACIGLALVLDKLDKHATAVFSGEVPSAMEFLKPDETLEQTPNSLRDFIIALDKTKADKLRYKVEDKVVRIFITPYKTSLSQDDLEFSQGDFNIDVVVALGVHEQAELDSAITEHGRILHDAAVISINNTPNSNLGSLNWQDVSASSVSEMVADLTVTIDKNVLDEQVATALLTGVVAETARFSNDKTTPKTMNLAGELMAAGANQQLVADKLRGETHDVPHDAKPTEEKSSGADGTLEISHPEPSSNDTPAEEPKSSEQDQKVGEQSDEKSSDEIPDLIPTKSREMLPVPELGNTPAGQVGTLLDNPFTGEFKDEETSGAQHGFLIDQAAEIAAGAPGSTANASAQPDGIDLPPVVTPAAPILTHDQPVISLLPDDDTVAPVAAIVPELPAMPLAPESPVSVAPMALAAQSSDDDADQTLEDIEESVHSSHVAEDSVDLGIQTPRPFASTDSNPVDEARAQVEAALKQITQPPKPLEGLGAQPLGDPLHAAAAAPVTQVPVAAPPQIDVDEQGNLRPAGSPLPLIDPRTPRAMDMPLPPVSPSGSLSGPSPSQGPASVPPPAVPPPFMPPFSPPPAS